MLNYQRVRQTLFWNHRHPQQRNQNQSGRTSWKNDRRFPRKISRSLAWPKRSGRHTTSTSSKSWYPLISIDIHNLKISWAWCKICINKWPSKGAAACSCPGSWKVPQRTAYRSQKHSDYLDNHGTLWITIDHWQPGWIAMISRSSVPKQVRLTVVMLWTRQQHGILHPVPACLVMTDAIGCQEITEFSWAGQVITSCSGCCFSSLVVSNVSTNLNKSKTIWWYLMFPVGKQQTPGTIDVKSSAIWDIWGDVATSGRCKSSQVLSHYNPIHFHSCSTDIPSIFDSSSIQYRNIAFIFH